MATNYSRGADFERRVKAKLEADGWTCFRSAGSKSPVDLICVRGSYAHNHKQALVLIPEVRLVQCKSGVKPMPRKERETLRVIAEELGAEAIVATRGLKLEAA